MNQPAEYAALNTSYPDVLSLIEEFPEEFKNMNGRIIDIGCGPGNVTAASLPPNVGKDAVIVGTDLSADMIEYAKKNHTIKDKLSFLQLDIETSELPESLIGQFDNVVSIYCLHWCRNMKTALGNMYKLLRSGGKAIVLVFSHYVIYDIYPEQQKDPRFSPYMQDMMKYIPLYHGDPNAEEMMKRDLKEAGFKILHCTNKWKTYTYPNLDFFLDLMMSINPFVKRMPEHLQKNYRKDMEIRLMKMDPSNKTNQDSDDCTFDCHRICRITGIFEKPQIG